MDACIQKGARMKEYSFANFWVRNVEVLFGRKILTFHLPAAFV